MRDDFGVAFCSFSKGVHRAFKPSVTTPGVFRFLFLNTSHKEVDPHGFRNRAYAFGVDLLEETKVTAVGLPLDRRVGIGWTGCGVRAHLNQLSLSH